MHIDVHISNHFYVSGMPLGLFQKVGKYRGMGGLGADPPAGSRGSALVGVEGGETPLKLELFLNQNCPESHQLTRMVVTHTLHARKKKKRKVGTSEKVGIPTKVRKTASLMFAQTCSSSRLFLPVLIALVIVAAIGGQTGRICAVVVVIVSLPALLIVIVVR